MQEHGDVITEIKNNIAFITFFHPQSNSLPGVLLRKIAEEITEAGMNDQVRVIVLKSKNDNLAPGKTGTFCSGASFDELIATDTFEKGKYFFSGFAAVINAMRKAPKFTIARIQGKAVGGGVGLAAAADYSLAHESASVKLSELAIGIGPFVVGPAVERKMGKSAFTALAINATEWKTAAWAKEKGLYDELYTTIDELDNAVNSLAEKLSEFNPEAMMMLKRTCWAGTENWDALLMERAEISGKLVLSDFTKKAIEKFKSKA